jgi:hypothetical protein
MFYFFTVVHFLGIGTFGRGILILAAIGNNIVKLNFMFCSIPTAIIFATSYRLEQPIALMIAMDRLIAIWKPIWYNNNQNYVNFLIDRKLNWGALIGTSSGSQKVAQKSSRFKRLDFRQKWVIF